MPAASELSRHGAPGVATRGWRDHKGNVQTGLNGGGATAVRRVTESGQRTGEPATTSLDFTLNGEPVRVTGASPNTPLLDWLRANGRTGAKQGCAEGDCGACTVALSDLDATGRPTWRAINACIALLPMVAGRELRTVEGIGDGCHPAQRAMVEHHGSQCGYCTPGFVMSMFEGCGRSDLRERWQVGDQLSGNLCRCTGYRPIADAAAEVFAGGGELSAPPTAASPTPALAYGEEGGERFLRPASLGELLDLRARFPEAHVIAGATELGLEVTKKFHRFVTLLSVEAVAELRTITRTAEAWTFGAGASLTQIEEALRTSGNDAGPAATVILKMLRVWGSRPIRNRATLGGNLANASPIGDLAPVLLALDARLRLVSAADGERELPLAEFFLAYRRTALRPDEILRAIVVPTPPAPAEGAGRRLVDCFKVSKRREMDISIVAAAFAVDLDAAGVVTAARLAYGGVAATTVRARQTEAALLGQPWNRETLTAVLPTLAAEFTPISDVRGSAEYRAGLITALFEKFFLLDGAPEPETAPDRAPITAPDAPFQHPRQHESALGHVTGRARYVDDAAPRRGTLEAWPVCAPHARARILHRDASAARRMPGVHAVLLAEDIPGLNDVGAVRQDEPLLAATDISFRGQLVALVIGESAEACRLAAAAVSVEYEPLPPILSIPDAIAADSFHTDPHAIRRGDADAALTAAPRTLRGELTMGGQEHFYLETHAAWAEPGEDGQTVFVHSSTQHPSEVQACVAHVLHLQRHQVVVECPRMGGGFGGKETQGNAWAALAALGARVTGRPVRVRLDRDQDMALTGKRHPVHARWQVGFDDNGLLHALKVELFANGGWSLDLSAAIADRALFHLDNGYYLPHVHFAGRTVRTNVVSNTAFRGFGGPQGMIVVEEVVDHVARTLGLPPETVRERNLYHGEGETNTTHYGQPLGNNRLNRIWHTLKATCGPSPGDGIAARRAAVVTWNAAHPHRKRGLAMTPVKFGISFTVTHLNQAGAHLLVYGDGSVQVNHGGTEMGQGLHTKMLTVAARALGLPPSGSASCSPAPTRCRTPPPPPPPPAATSTAPPSPTPAGSCANASTPSPASSSNASPTPNPPPTPPTTKPPSVGAPPARSAARTPTARPRPPSSPPVSPPPTLTATARKAPPPPAPSSSRTATSATPPTPAGASPGRKSSPRPTSSASPSPPPATTLPPASLTTASPAAATPSTTSPVAPPSPRSRWTASPGCTPSAAWTSSTTSANR